MTNTFEARGSCSDCVSPTPEDKHGDSGTYLTLSSYFTPATPQVPRAQLHVSP